MLSPFRFIRSLFGGPTTIRRSLLRNMVVLILLTSGAILGTTYWGARRTARDLSHILLRVAMEWTEAELGRSFGPVRRNLLATRAWGRAGILDDSGDSRRFNRLFIPILEQFPQISSVNLANSKGFGHLLLRDPETWTWKNRVVRVGK